MTMLGRSDALPSASRRLRQRFSSAMPPSMAASLEPMVDVPTASSFSGEFQSRAIMLTQRASISAVCGYSSLSARFLLKVSCISRSASGSIQVPTNVARFSRELPSSISSSWTR